MPRVKSTSRVYAPSLVCVVDVGTKIVDFPGTADAAGSAFESVSFICHRRIAGKWYQVAKGDYDDDRSFWEAYRAIPERKERLYTVCRSAFDSLCHLRWWDRVASGYFRLKTVPHRPDGPAHAPVFGAGSRSHSLVLSGLPDIIGFEWQRAETQPRERTGSTATGGRNPSTRRVARWVGVRQFGDPEFPRFSDPHAGCRIVWEWFRRILDSWLGSSCGWWRDSAGAAAWSSYTMRSKRVPIVTHDDPIVQKLEGQACHGGRASAFFFGPVGTPEQWSKQKCQPKYPTDFKPVLSKVHRLDVRAMYPSLLRDCVFPTRLVGLSSNWSPSRLGRVSESTCLIARVRLKSVRSCLPVRSGKDVSFPAGSWVSTLASPELVEASKRDEIVKVYQVARYESGKPFEDWATWILGVRKRAKRHHSAAWSNYVKAVSVALSGRLAKKPGGWMDAAGVCPPCEWGEFYRRSAQTGKSVKYRSLCGHVQRLEIGDVRPGTLAACYAHLTAYGRVQMDRYREIAGRKEVLSQHTDGLVVTDTGLANLRRAGCVGKGEYGQLQYESSHDCLLFRTANHFWLDGEWVAAGLSGGFVVDENATGRTAVTHNPARRAALPVGGILLERIQAVKLDEVERGVRIGPDGWSVPPTVGPTLRNHQFDLADQQESE